MGDSIRRLSLGFAVFSGSGYTGHIKVPEDQLHRTESPRSYPSETAHNNFT